MLLLELFDLLAMLLLDLLNLLLKVRNGGCFGRVLEVEVRHLALHVRFYVFNQVYKSVLL